MGHRCALAADLATDGEQGTRQKYLKLDPNEVEEMDEIRLTPSTSNNNTFTHSDLDGKPAGAPLRSMRGHYKFDPKVKLTADGTLERFHYGELHMNRVPALGLGRSGLTSYISKGLHVAVDGAITDPRQLGSFRFLYPFVTIGQAFRNIGVDIAEGGYCARTYYVF